MVEIINLNVKDVKLLHELERDARASLAEIGRKIGASKEVVNYRLKNLFSEGVIKRIGLIIDNFLLDMKHYRIVLDLHNVQEGTRDDLVRFLRGMKNVEVSVFLQSSTDLEISLKIKNSGEFYDFYNKLLDDYGQYIKQKKLSVVTKEYFLGHRYLWGESEIKVIGRTSGAVELDNKDYELIEELVKDCRIGILDLGKKLSLSPSSIIYKLRNLQKKKIIIGHNLILNLEVLGFNLFRVGILLSDLSKKDLVINFLFENKNVVKINELIGERDLEFDCVFRTVGELDKFLEKLRASGQYIRDFDVTNVVEA